MIYKCLIVIIAVGMLCGCGLAKFKYTDGDGVFTDRGPGAAIDRYWLSLGNIDLSKPFKKKFLIGDLPNDHKLNLFLLFKLNRETYLSDKAALIIWDRFETVKLRIKVSSQSVGETKYGYEGVLYEDGHEDGKYYRKGLSPGSGGRGSGGGGYEHIALGVPNSVYGFNEKYYIFGFETPFYKNLKREIELEIIKPMTVEPNDAVPPGSGIIAEIVISGGGWK